MHVVLRRWVGEKEGGELSFRRLRKNPLSGIGLGPDTVAKRRALRALDAAAALGAPAWRVDFHRGLVEELRGAFDAAAARYRDALVANPDCAEAQQRLTGIEARRHLEGGR